MDEVSRVELIQQLTTEWSTLTPEKKIAIQGVLGVMVASSLPSSTVLLMVVHDIANKCTNRQLTLLRQLSSTTPVDQTAEPTKPTQTEPVVHAYAKLEDCVTVQKAEQRLFMSPLLLPALYEKDLITDWVRMPKFTSSTGFHIIMDPTVTRCETRSNLIRVPLSLVGQWVDLSQTYEESKSVPEATVAALRKALEELAVTCMESEAMKKLTAFSNCDLTPQTVSALVGLNVVPEKTIKTTRRLLYLSPAAVNFLNRLTWQSMPCWWESKNRFLFILKGPEWAYQHDNTLGKSTLVIPDWVATSGRPVDLEQVPVFRGECKIGPTGWSRLCQALEELNQLISKNS